MTENLIGRVIAEFRDNLRMLAGEHRVISPFWMTLATIHPSDRTVLLEPTPHLFKLQEGYPADQVVHAIRSTALESKSLGVLIGYEIHTINAETDADLEEAVNLAVDGVDIQDRKDTTIHLVFYAETYGGNHMWIASVGTWDNGSRPVGEWEVASDDMLQMNPYTKLLPPPPIFN